MEAFAGDVAHWRKHTASLTKHAMAAVENGRGGTELVAAVQQMRDAFIAAMRSAQVVERLAQTAQPINGAPQSAKTGRKRNPSEAISPQQAQWMAELKAPKGPAPRLGKMAPKKTTALSVEDRQEIWELFHVSWSL